MVEHVLEREWEGSSAAGWSHYWATCSCGWKTAFKTNVQSLVTDAMEKGEARDRGAGEVC